MTASASVQENKIKTHKTKLQCASFRHTLPQAKAAKGQTSPPHLTAPCPNWAA